MKVNRQILVALSLVLFSSNLFSQNIFPTAVGTNVGIGTTSPITKLQVDGDINSTGATLSLNKVRKIGFITTDVNNSTDGIANYGLSNVFTFPTGAGTAVGPGITLSGYHGLSFYTNASERVRINRSGNFGVGTTDVQSKFQVENGDINSTGWSNLANPRRIGFYTTDLVNTTDGIANYGLTYSGRFPTGVSTNLGPGITFSGYYGLGFYTTGFERIRITYDGKIGIGKINPSSMLDVNGEITALAIKGPSDIRFKKNLKPLENSLDKIIKLNGYSYEWRKDEFPNKNFKKGSDIGLIAQEVEKVFPEVVYTDNDDMKSKSIDYSKLVPALVESIKELQKELEALKAELNQKK